METQKIISTSDCLYKLQEIIDEPSRPKRQKLGTFENVCKILQKFNVSISVGDGRDRIGTDVPRL